MKLNYWLMKVLSYGPAILICTVLATLVTLLLMIFWPRRVRHALGNEDIEQWQWAKNNRNRTHNADQQEAVSPEVAAD